VQAILLKLSDKKKHANVFDLSISPQLFALGVVWALALALLGALPPAIRAARLPVPEALRAI
jgi:putative ABC transport system permease protein